MLYNNIVGQDKVKDYLKKSVKINNISHSYIFEGPKSIGKLDLALVFAQSILCSDFNEEPCNNCNTCLKINTNNHPDVHIIDVDDKNIKRENIDEIIKSIYIKPYEAKKKIYIINNSQNMTLQAANTFLKTLEEPPKNTVIILTTTNINLLIPTIVSRCQIIKFNNISKAEICDELVKRYNLNLQKAKMISDYSKGILNRAIKIAENEDNILEERKNIIKIIDNVLCLGKDVIYEYEDYFEEKKDRIDDVIELIMIWMRDVAFKKENLDDLIINKDCIDVLEKHSKKITLEKVSDMIQYLQNVSFDIKYHVNYKLVIDKMLFKLQDTKLNNY